jgi:hypothetical protein
MEFDLPICRDCRWCSNPGRNWSPCSHDAAGFPSTNLVSGCQERPPIYCSNMRGRTGPCGVEGRLFEAKS